MHLRHIIQDALLYTNLCLCPLNVVAAEKCIIISDYIMSDKSNDFKHGENIFFAFRSAHVTKYVYYNNSSPAFKNMLAYLYNSMAYNLVVKL